MNVIDLFKSLGMYNNAPQMEEFYISFLPSEYKTNPKNVFCKLKNNKIFGYWFDGMIGRESQQTGIFFYLDVDSEKHMDTEQKIRRKKDQYFFNNYWPKEGNVGEIDLQTTIILNIERPEITSKY